MPPDQQKLIACFARAAGVRPQYMADVAAGRRKSKALLNEYHDFLGKFAMLLLEITKRRYAKLDSNSG